MPHVAPDLRSLFSERQWASGKDYVAQGRLFDLLAAPEGLAGTVRGYQGNYGVTVLWHRPATVTCSYCDHPCRHAAALALAYSENPKAFLDLEALVDAFLSAPDPHPLRRAALTGELSKELQAFLHAAPGTSPRSRLRALSSLPPGQRLAALSRMGALGDPLLGTLAERDWQKLLADLPLPPLLRLCLEHPNDLAPLLAPLAERLEREPPEPLLHTLLGLGHLAAAEGKSPGPLLARAIALLPQGDTDAARALTEAFPDEAEPAEALVQFLALSGHPKEALSEAAALAARSPRHLPLAIAQAEAAGSVLEARLRLRAFALGDGSQLEVLCRRFPELLDAGWGELVEAMAPAGRFALLVDAAARRKNMDALSALVTKNALPFGPLSRALGLLSGAGRLPDPAAVRFDLLSGQAKETLKRRFWAPG